MSCEPAAYPFNNSEGLEISDIYAKARESGTLLRVQLAYGEPAWLVTRYADARFVYGDNRFSRSMALERDQPRQVPETLDEGLMSMDPPENTRLRGLVAKALTARRVEQLRPWIRSLAEGLLDGLMAKGDTAELAVEYGLALPGAVICELFGVPKSDHGDFIKWSNATVSSEGLTTEQAAEYRATQYEYMMRAIAERRERPTDDLLSGLIEARDEQDKLSEFELVASSLGLLFGGYETVASQIPNFTLLLLENPEEWQRLIDDPGLIPNAIEELTRFVPLGTGASFARYATEDVRIGDVLVKRGEPVLVSIGAANLDPAQFDEPGELRLDRKQVQHLGYGHGPHHCPGAALARCELQEALRALTVKMPKLRLAGELVWKKGMMVRAPKVMPVTW
ncbi:Cytochrome P450 [Amycolatopsis xylanica]|uniref:Cytochrome P450 n=2 Tax=Amycolatopsis xylanica TaxID=589385 RepID=A0A1H2TRS6_9PSEU|nr:Cytochrome P450 [Amycolatopsis xylanica]